jgi:hypothetical protein
MVVGPMVLASSSSDRIKQVHTSLNSRRQETRMSTLPCRLVHVARVPRHIWRSIMKALPTVRPFYCQACYSTQFFAGTLEELIKHGLHALRETLQQDKELNVNNTSISITGPTGLHEKPVSPLGKFRIVEGDAVKVYLESMDVKVTEEAPAPPAAAADEDVQMSG